MFEDFYLAIKPEVGYDNVVIPNQAHEDDAGFDVYAPYDFVIFSNSDKLIPLGWSCEFPKGYGMLFIEKSGRATKNKLTLGARLVDAGYRGMVYIHLFNNGLYPVHIKKGEKISQFIIIPVWHGKAEVVKKLSDSERGEKGLGGTGLK